MTLKAGDLKNLIDEVFEIDSYRSKMGDDKNIVTLSFSVKDKQPAEDLANFLEKGYNFILDADATPGEQSDGKYKVFVELQRERNVGSNICEILDGVTKISEMPGLKFRYYKDFQSKDANLQEIESMVPTDPDNYAQVATESNMRNFKNFFNKSYVDEIIMEGDIFTIRKKYADPVQFRYLDFGPTQQTLDSINESFNANEFAEIIFLSKYIGDYNITKYGHKLTFENNGFTLVAERIIV